MSRVSHLLRQRAIVTRNVKSVVDAQVVEAPQVIATGVPCRITGPSRRSLVIYAGAEQAKRPHSIYFEPGADVAAEDRVTVNGASYRVLDAEDQPDGVYRMASAELLA